MELLDAGAYGIFSDMGVCINDKGHIQELKDTPIQIDEKELNLKFPECWVCEMLTKVPKNVTLSGTKGRG
jgi:trimethylamine:corrinoid methyltransferase-like protein